MARFVAVPSDWSNAQAEAYQREKGADGYTLGLSETAKTFFPEGTTLPLVWEEDSENSVNPAIIDSGE